MFDTIRHWYAIATHRKPSCKKRVDIAMQSLNEAALGLNIAIFNARQVVQVKAKNNKKSVIR